MRDERTREGLLLVSELLGYPGEDMPSRLPAYADQVSGLPTPVRRPLEEFLREAAGLDGFALAEAYVTAFDLKGGVCLDLTYARYGDDRKRGAALADLKRRYQEAGFVPRDGELPDHLPLLLEFLGSAPEWAVRALAGEFLPEIRDLVERLRPSASPYRHVLEAGVEAVSALPRAGRKGR